MRTFFLPALLGLAFLSACSTPQTRIESSRTVFEKFPAEIQAKIRAGQIDVGFTPEMVRIALGEPARQLTIKTEAGEAEVWVYRDDKPQFSFGFGMASGGPHSAVGLGLATGTGGYEPDERVRVVFRLGRVAQIEYRKG